jgi:hypothetical protein
MSRLTDILVRYRGAWGLGDLLCSDPMIEGLRERHGPNARIWLSGHAGNVAHREDVRLDPPAGLIPDVTVNVDLFTHMTPEAYGVLEAMPSLIDHMCSYAGVTPADRRPRLHLTEADRDAARATGVERLRRPRIALCTDYLDPLRHWPAERWREVATVLSDAGFSLVEVGAKDRLGMGLDLVGRVPIRVSAAVLEHCDLFLGHNSGLFHYAQAAGVPCVTLFSLATPSRFVHPGARVHPVQANWLPCIDCMTRRFASMARSGCIAQPRGRCMAEISVQMVLDVVASALEKLAATSERASTHATRLGVAARRGFL